MRSSRVTAAAMLLAVLVLELATAQQQSDHYKVRLSSVEGAASGV